MTRRFWHVGINVTDLQRSIEFYKTVGFKLLHQGPVQTPQVGLAFLVDGGDSLRFAHMRIGDNDAESMLDLIEWVNPRSTGSADVDLHAPGLCRFSILTDDADREYESLGAQGIEFLQAPVTVTAPDGSKGWKILFAKDPDGTLFHFVELVGDHAH